MSPELEALKKDTDALLDGPDKREALAAVAELQHLDDEVRTFQEKTRRMEEQAKENRVTRRTLAAKFVGPPVGLFLGYLAISASFETARSGIVHPAFPLALFGVPALALLLYVFSLKPTLPAPRMHGQPAEQSASTVLPKSRIIGMGVVAAMAALMLSLDMIPDALQSGRYQSSGGATYTAAANPIAFWAYVFMLAICAVFCVAGVAGLVAMFIRHLRPPFGGAAAAVAAEVDPLAEAEVYVSYGRLASAIDILEEAHAARPKRQDIAKRLSELRGRVE